MTSVDRGKIYSLAPCGDIRVLIGKQRRILHPNRFPTPALDIPDECREQMQEGNRQFHTAILSTETQNALPVNEGDQIRLGLPERNH